MPSEVGPWLALYLIALFSSKVIALGLHSFWSINKAWSSTSSFSASSFSAHTQSKEDGNSSERYHNTMHTVKQVGTYYCYTHATTQSGEESIFTAPQAVYRNTRHLYFFFFLHICPKLTDETPYKVRVRWPQELKVVCSAAIAASNRFSFVLFYESLRQTQFRKKNWSFGKCDLSLVKNELSFFIILNRVFTFQHNLCIGGCHLPWK